MTFQDIPVCTSTLARSGADNSEEPAGLELLDESRVQHTRFDVFFLGFLEGFLLGEGVLGLYLGEWLFLLLLAEFDAVVPLVPDFEGGRVDLDDSAQCERIGADQLIVGSVVHDVEDSRLASDAFAAPGVVAAVEAQSSEFEVASAAPDSVDALGAQASVGGLASLLEGTLFLVDGHSPARQAALVSGVSGYAHLLMVINRLRARH